MSVPGTLINVVGGILTPLMIYATFDANASGQYALLERSLSLPLGLVIVSVSQVFTSQFAASFRTDRGQAIHAFNKIVKVMALAGMAPVLLLVLAGPTLFALLFGEQWRTAGELARVMAPAYWSMLVVGTVNMVVTVVGYQKTQTAWEIIRLASMVALWLMVPRLGLSLGQAVLGHAAVTIVVQHWICAACKLDIAACESATNSWSFRPERAPMITIVDYGVGNIASLINMYDHLGHTIAVSDQPDRIRAADKLILPGVGAFDKAMSTLRAKNLVSPIRDAVLERGRPLLGVCLGMQLLARGSEEGSLPGLGLIDADVVRIPAHAHLKVPHMGWAEVELCAPAVLFPPSE